MKRPFKGTCLYYWNKYGRMNLQLQCIGLLRGMCVGGGNPFKNICDILFNISSATVSKLLHFSKKSHSCQRQNEFLLWDCVCNYGMWYFWLIFHFEWRNNVQAQILSYWSNHLTPRVLDFHAFKALCRSNKKKTGEMILSTKCSLVTILEII